MTHDTISEVFEKFRGAFFREEAGVLEGEEDEADILKKYTRFQKEINAALETCDFHSTARLGREAAEYIKNNIVVSPDGLMRANDAYHKVAEGLFASGQYEELKSFLRHVMVKQSIPNNILQLFNISVRMTDAEAVEKKEVIDGFYSEYSKISAVMSANGGRAEGWINLAKKVDTRLGQLNYHRMHLVAGAYYHAARAVLDENPEQGKKYLEAAIETNPHHRAAYRLLNELKE